MRVGESSLPIGGGKQRTVLALLVLRAGEIVPVERLIDELWSDDPPPSAAHTVEGYISRLRGSCSPTGRRSSVAAAATGSISAAGRLTPGRSSHSSTTARRQRLPASTSELPPCRSRECSSGAALRWPMFRSGRRRIAWKSFDCGRSSSDRRRAAASTRSAGVVAELSTLVGEHPHRERLVAQLMVALYRSGRHADALAVYEATRRSLADELGLQPSADLQRLSGDIVRQETTLTLPVDGRPGETAPTATRPRRLRAATVLAAAVGVATLAAIAVTNRGDEGGAAGAGATRVALLLPRAPSVGHGVPIPSDLVDGLRLAERRYGVDTEFMDLPELKPDSPKARATAQHLRVRATSTSSSPLAARSTQFDRP